MAVYPIKMLKDEGNNPFVPLVGTNAIVDAQGQSLDDKFATKLEAVNIIAGENITLQKVGNNITINGHAGSSVSLIDNLTTTTPGLGALDARQGKALKDLIPAVINNLNSTSTTSALSAYQGYLLKNRVVPAGGTTGQVLKKSSNADNAVEWGDAADPNAISGDGSIKEIIELTYAEYKALEEIDPDTEYHISDLEGGTSTYINEAQIQDMIDDSIDAIGLKTVATSGDYNDLINKPIIDTSLSTTSTNAVQNKILTSASGVSTLLNQLTTGSSTPSDADYYICQYAGGGTSTTTYHRRPTSALWTYINSKMTSAKYYPNSYSTTEQIIGKWINNKNIYRKVIEYSGNASSIAINTGISNMEWLVNGYAVALMSGSTIYLPMNFYNSGGWNTFHVTQGGAAIQYQRGTSYETVSVKFILEYTKTTG